MLGLPKSSTCSFFILLKSSFAFFLSIISVTSGYQTHRISVNLNFPHWNCYFLGVYPLSRTHMVGFHALPQAFWPPPFASIVHPWKQRIFGRNLRMFGPQDMSARYGSKLSTLQIGWLDSLIIYIYVYIYRYIHTIHIYSDYIYIYYTYTHIYILCILYVYIYIMLTVLNMVSHQTWSILIKFMGALIRECCPKMPPCFGQDMSTDHQGAHLQWSLEATLAV